MEFKNKTLKEFLEENRQNLNEVDNEEMNDVSNEPDEEPNVDSTLEQQWFDFLKQQIEQYCNENKQFEIYWDYRDTLDPQQVVDAVNTAVGEGSTPEAVLSDTLFEMNYDYEDNFYDEIRSNVPDELMEYALDRDLYEDLYKAGYNGLDMNIQELLDRTNLKVNILFATPAEKNSDMSSLIKCYGSYRSPDFENITETDLDNCMTYLIHQQGHSIKEYYECLLDNPSGFGFDHKSTFIESCVDDCVNNSSEAMSVITALVSLTAEQYYTLIQNVNTWGDNITINKDAYTGTFNPWGGSGGLSIELEKDMIIPTAYIYKVQVEGADNVDSTVDDVFGLVVSAWDGNMSYGGTPELYQEDMSEVLEYIHSLANETDEEE